MTAPDDPLIEVDGVLYPQSYVDMCTAGAVTPARDAQLVGMRCGTFQPGAQPCSTYLGCACVGPLFVK
jgi:hypothetical protein